MASSTCLVSKALEASLISPKLKKVEVLFEGFDFITSNGLKLPTPLLISVTNESANLPNGLGVFCLAVNVIYPP